MNRLHVNPDSPIPLHVQAEHLLREMIEDRHYQAGNLLPEEVGLAQQLGVSRGTLRAAIGRLVQAGAIERVRGRGTRVRPDRLDTHLNAWGSFTSEMNAKGVTVDLLSTQARMVRASLDLARRFDIVEGSQVLRLDRLRGIGGEPAVFFRSFLHPRLALTPQADFDRPLYALLRETAGVEPVWSKEELSAEPAGKRLAKLLKMTPKGPVLLRRRLVTDANRSPLEYSVCYYRGDRFRYTTELKRADRVDVSL